MNTIKIVIDSHQLLLINIIEIAITAIKLLRISIKIT